jgi:plasmid stabilization system protein ParE
VPKRRFRVLWAEAATRDFEELIGYIADDSIANAARLLTRLEARAAGLERTPLRGRVVPELAQFGIHTLRELIERPYRIVYRVASDTVIVVALFDGRRDLEDVLLERLVRV